MDLELFEGLMETNEEEIVAGENANSVTHVGATFTILWPDVFEISTRVWKWVWETDEGRS